MGYLRLQRVIRVPGVTGRYKGLPGDTSGYKGLQGVTEGWAHRHADVVC